MNLPKTNVPKVMNLRYWLVTWCIYWTLRSIYTERDREGDRGLAAFAKE